MRWSERSEPPHSVIITYETFRTVCGRDDENAEAPSFDGVGERPEGVCQSCWAKYKKAYAAAAAAAAAADWFTDLNDVD